MAKTKIMIIDDDPQIREIYKAALEMRGYEVVPNPGGEKVMDMLSKGGKPDLILLDVMMPKVSGLDVLDMLKSDADLKDVKVIMMTAVSDESIRKKTEERGAYAYIVKSELSMSEVISKIEDALHN